MLSVVTNKRSKSRKFLEISAALNWGSNYFKITGQIYGNSFVKVLVDLATLVTTPVVNQHGTLDELAAESRFGGMSYACALKVFKSSDVWFCEDLMWMASPGFKFYFCTFLNALEDLLLELDDDYLTDRISMLVMILEFRGREFIQVSTTHESVVKELLERLENWLANSDDVDALRVLKLTKLILNNWPARM